MKILDLLSSEEACSRFFRYVRWRSSISCPRCGSVRVKGHRNYAQGLKRHFCKTCGKTFNDKTGTLFHYSSYVSLISLNIDRLLYSGIFPYSENEEESHATKSIKTRELGVSQQIEDKPRSGKPNKFYHLNLPENALVLSVDEKTSI